MDDAEDKHAFDDDDGYRDMPVRNTFMRAGYDVRVREDQVTFATDMRAVVERRTMRIHNTKRRNTVFIWVGAAISTAIINQAVNTSTLSDWIVWLRRVI